MDDQLFLSNQRAAARRSNAVLAIGLTIVGAVFSTSRGLLLPEAPPPPVAALATLVPPAKIAPAASGPGLGRRLHRSGNYHAPASRGGAGESVGAEPAAEVDSIGGNLPGGSIGDIATRSVVLGAAAPVGIIGPSSGGGPEAGFGPSAGGGSSGGGDTGTAPSTGGGSTGGGDTGAGPSTGGGSTGGSDTSTGPSTGGGSIGGGDTGVAPSNGGGSSGGGTTTGPSTPGNGGGTPGGGTSGGGAGTVPGGGAGTDDGGDVPPASSVPEPATWSLFIVAIGMIGGVLRADRRRLRELASSAG